MVVLPHPSNLYLNTISVVSFPALQNQLASSSSAPCLPAYNFQLLIWTCRARQGLSLFHQHFIPIITQVISRRYDICKGRNKGILNDGCDNTPPPLLHKHICILSVWATALRTSVTQLTFWYEHLTRMEKTLIKDCFLNTLCYSIPCDPIKDLMKWVELL